MPPVYDPNSRRFVFIPEPISKSGRVRSVPLSQTEVRTCPLCNETCHENISLSVAQSDVRVCPFCLNHYFYHQPRATVRPSTFNTRPSPDIKTCPGCGENYNAAFPHVCIPKPPDSPGFNQVGRVNSTSLGSSSNRSSESGFLRYVALILVGVAILFIPFSNQKPLPRQENNPPVSPTPTQENSPSTAGIIRVKDSRSNAATLRSAPNSNSATIAYLMNGVPVTLGALSSDGQWQQVRTYNGVTGWVLAELIHRVN